MMIQCLIQHFKFNVPEKLSQIIATKHLLELDPFLNQFYLTEWNSQSLENLVSLKHKERAGRKCQIRYDFSVTLDQKAGNRSPAKECIIRNI